MIGTVNFFAGKISDLKGNFGIDFSIKVQGEELLYNNGHYYGPNDVELKKPLDEKINQAFNVSSGFKYVLSGLHLAHLIGGLMYLLMVIIRAFGKRYNSNYMLDIELISLYWHFLGILWIYLFAFLFFIQ
jgi:cytochrome c oxidase subunit 3